MELDEEFYGLAGLGADATPATTTASGQPLTWQQVLANALVGSAQGGLTAAQMALAQQAQAKVNAGQGNQLATRTNWTPWLWAAGLGLTGYLIYRMAKKKRRK